MAGRRRRGWLLAVAIGGAALVVALVAHALTRQPLGVLVGAAPAGDGSLPARVGHYDTVVLDADALTAGEVSDLHARGQRVFAYLNVGSLEEGRTYYSRYSSLCLDPYDNWPDERWVDVSDTSWQAFLASRAKRLAGMGVDGLFLDNLDVYSRYPTQATYDGLVACLGGVRGSGLTLVANGGDQFLTAYADAGGSLASLVDGVCQECVYTCVEDYAGAGSFGRQSAEDVAYWEGYLTRMGEAGLDVWVVEYTRDPPVACDVARSCADHGWTCYVVGSLSLD